ncbi:hypothetical protein TNCV_1958171 [Trichonephila clavipes]|nr:hypothetical protein TNCV_1958171 [Trichonephila clavipes]
MRDGGKTLHRHCFFGRLDCEAVLNPISGHVFDEGHGESGVLRSAEWHDDDWLDRSFIARREPRVLTLGQS